MTHIDPNNNRTTLQYDARNLVTTVTFKSGRVQASSYDENSRQTVQRDVNGAVTLQVFTLTYDENSSVLTVRDNNGATTTYTYDNADRLTQDATSGTNAHTYNYTYDAASHPVRMPRRVGSESEATERSASRRQREGNEWNEPGRNSKNIGLIRLIGLILSITTG